MNGAMYGPQAVDELVTRRLGLLRCIRSVNELTVAYHLESLRWKTSIRAAGAHLDIFSGSTCRARRRQLSCRFAADVVGLWEMAPIFGREICSRDKARWSSRCRSRMQPFRGRRSRGPLQDKSKGLGAVQPGRQTPRFRCEAASVG